MLFPEIPEDLNALSSTELRALAREIKAAASKSLAIATLSQEDFETTTSYMAKRLEIIALAETKEAVAAATAALADDTSDEDPAPAAPAAPAAGDDDGGEGGDGGGDAGTGAGDGDASVRRGGGTALATSTGQQTLSAPAPKGGAIINYLVAAEALSGKDTGESFSSWAELAAAVQDRAENVNANTSEKFNVAKVKANYPKERILGDDAVLNLQKFEPDEMTAALCAPATPYYDMHCMNTTRRPVFNGLPQFQAPRMKVSIMPSPTLSDITGGTGIWTAANEASTNAVKAACQTITCGSPTEYQAYGVYRCMTIRNMLAMSYPELVEAWLNRLAAAQARLAEIQLLNAMGTAATAISAPLLGYGASTTVISTLLNYLALFQETQRWDLTDNLDIWGHRWILAGLKMEIFRRRTTNGEVRRVITDAEVNAMFTNAGFNPHWFIDTPTWSEAVPSVSTGGVLNRLPANVNFLIHAPGKFALIDRGELRIGVTGNGIYRDNTSNSRNEFTYFVESFEGLVDTAMCGAHVLTIPVCWNGAQIDDIVINCQGGDEGGYQS